VDLRNIVMVDGGCIAAFASAKTWAAGRVGGALTGSEQVRTFAA